MKRVLKHKANQNSTLNSARALYYDFFAGFFLYELLDSRFEKYQAQIDLLAQTPLNEDDLASFKLLSANLKRANLIALKQEYAQTFNIPFVAQNDFKPHKKRENAIPNPQIFLYLSHYMEGCLNGASLLSAKMLVKKTNFRLNSEDFKESEEHFGFLLTLMRYLLQSDENALAHEVFSECIAQMALPIADSLCERKNLAFYSHIGAILKSFIALEGEIN